MRHDAYMRIATGQPGDWGPQLRRFRRLRAMKQTSLAAMLGVDQATVSRWESGRQMPDLGMQRRLRSLMRRAEPRQELLLRHLINASVGFTVLSDEDRNVVAASPSFCAFHKVSAHDIVGRSLIPAFTEELDRLWDLVVDRGFLEGEIASVSLVSRTHLLSGAERDIGTMGVWTPVSLSDGQVLRRVDVIRVGEEQFAQARAENGGPVRLVTMDDLTA